METVILGWYVLVETDSVLLLTAFGSLQFLGTLISPLFGVAGDRLGYRNVLCGMRLVYTVLALALMAFAGSGSLTPTHVFVIASIAGLVRPSDLVLRNSLIGQTIPSGHLMGAMSISRTTMDSARIAGALAGAGFVALLGIGPAYAVVAALYAGSLVLTWRIVAISQDATDPTTAGQAPPAVRPSPWRDLRDAIAHVRTTPHLVAILGLAFLVNLTAYPFVTGLLPYIARDVYGADQAALGYLVASYAGGALCGALFLARFSGVFRPARMMVLFVTVWYATIAAFSFADSVVIGVLALFFTGGAQSFGMVPMSVAMLRNFDPRFRGRVMGLRMLAVYGLPLGLMASAPLIDLVGFRTTTLLYCVLGIAVTVAIAYRWRQHVWDHDAPANAR
jgi:predicted MFS family arabinose efflux permease